MKIISLKSNNIKRIRAVEMVMDPNKNLVLVTGKNGQGKTSILDSIWYALGGKKNIPGQPIRKGEEKGEIEVNLDGFKIIRTFTAKDSYLKILTKEGSVYTDPQNFLNYVVGQLSFDPLEFSRMDSGKQIEGLIKITGLDFSEAEALKKKIIEDRLLVGREEKILPVYSSEELDAAAKTIHTSSELSISELSQKLTAETEKHNYYLQSQTYIENAKIATKNIEGEIDAFKLKIENMKKEISNHEKVEDTKENLELIQNNITMADETNQKIRKARQILDDHTKTINKRNEYVNLTNKIKAVDEEKATKLSEAKMPIEGLSWDDAGVLFNNIPFNQLSSAEQLKISMAIAMAANPKLKVILIRDGSLLDPDNLKVIEEMAKDKDWQVWIEKVNDDSKIGIYIEDGAVKAIDGKLII